MEQGHRYALLAHYQLRTMHSSTYWISWLMVGFFSYLSFTAWCIYKVLKMAHDEDPGCLNPNKH